MGSSTVRGSLIGATFAGYEVEALIGRGAMGSVYLARDVSLNRRVALKVLLGSLARSRSLVKQFHLEAQAAAPLNHPNIVRIYSAGVDDGTPYIAMEFVDGEPLEQFLHRKGKVSWQVGLHIGRQVAMALDCAHRHGIIHRDVKPSNIILDQKGQVRLTDFGIARIQTQEAKGGEGGGFLGTPQYMSPEQATGRQVGPSSDLFALGVTLYQVISGELPFQGESSMALIKSICSDDPPRLNKMDPLVPDDIARLVAYLMEKQPDNRPATAKVVGEMIRRLQDQRGEVNVISESITAFLKEQAEPHPFSNIVRQVSEPKKEKKERKPAKPWPWRPVAAFLTAILVSVCAFGLPFAIMQLEESRSIPEAPVFHDADFSPMPNGSVRVTLYIEGYRTKGLHWVPDRNVLIASFAGVPGTMYSGGEGVLAIDSEELRAYSLVPPAPPVLEAGADRFSAPRANSPHIVAANPQTPLYGSFLVHALDDGPNPVLVLSQRWDEAEPNPMVLYRTTVGAWYGPDELPFDSGRAAARAVASPKGTSFAVVAYDADLAYNYLMEVPVRSPENAPAPVRRTTPGRPLVPESVQYSPSGSQIAYLRQREEASYELWLLASGAMERDGIRLAGDVADMQFAFSPQGRHLAYVGWTEDRSRKELRVINLAVRRIVYRFGDATLSPQAWHASGDFLVAYRRGRDSAVADGKRGPALAAGKLVAFGVSELTKQSEARVLQEDVGPHYALSSDGRWLAVESMTSGYPGILLLPIKRSGGPTAGPS